MPECKNEPATESLVIPRRFPLEVLRVRSTIGSARCYEERWE